MGHVVIVGAGPAGASLSYLLARRGVEVTLIERRRDFSREFRGEVLLPGGLEVTYSLDPGSSGGQGMPILLRGLRTASWEALDPNGDALEFDVFLKADDEEDWKLIATRRDRRLFHIPSDRFEARDVSEQRPILTRYLTGLLWASSPAFREIDYHAPPSELHLDEAQLKELEEARRALGYIE